MLSAPWQAPVGLAPAVPVARKEGPAPVSRALASGTSPPPRTAVPTGRSRGVSPERSSDPAVGPAVSSRVTSENRRPPEVLTAGDAAWIWEGESAALRHLLRTWIEPWTGQLVAQLVGGGIASDPGVVRALATDVLDHARCAASETPVQAWLVEAVGLRCVRVWGLLDVEGQRAAVERLLPRFDEQGRRLGAVAGEGVDAGRGPTARELGQRICALPPMYRMAFVLADVHGVPMRGLARILRMPECRARRIVHEARLALTEQGLMAA